MRRLPTNTFAVALALAASGLPLTAQAQNIGYGSVTGGGELDPVEDDGLPSSGNRGRSRNEITPYIEAGQMVQKVLSPGDDVLTYTAVAAGVDTTLHGRNSAASASVRYEHRFGHSKQSADSNIVSGVARGYAKVAPGVRIDAGAVASRSRIEGDGSAILGPIGEGSSVSQIYSVYAGPTLSSKVGEIDLKGSYHIGYTKVEAPDALVLAPGQQAVDLFDESVTHSASIHAGVKPHTVLPIGLGVGATYNREDMSDLDERVEDFSARADITLQVDTDLAFVAGVGYEKVEVSSREALLDANGNPALGQGGNYVIDKSAPRAMAYDTDGLIWDAGVIWRPSRRTALEAHVGRRYGGTTYYGSFAYAPTMRSAINLAVYDNVAGMGGQLSRSLAALPTEFQAVRNPLSGDIGGCVAAVQGDASTTSNNCLSRALGSVRSSTFRSRGVMANYSLDLGSLQTGIGAGFDRRKFYGRPGSVLALANGTIEKNYWTAAYLGGRIDSHSSFSTSLYANWFQSGSGLDGDTTGVGGSATYSRRFGQRLTATAALGVDGIDRAEMLVDQWIASALLGLRYSF